MGKGKAVANLSIFTQERLENWQAYLQHDGSTLQTNKPRSLLNFTSLNRSLTFEVVIATPAFLS